MTTQPEALRLADRLDHGIGTIDTDRSKAALELRRLHAENEALRADAERWRKFLNTWLPNTHEVTNTAIDAAKERT